MNTLRVEGTEDTPHIVLDKDRGVLEISGRSLPEDSAGFYKPVLDWIEAYSKDPNADTTLIFKLEYFNTASSKLILDILYALEDVKGVKVQWHFLEDDEDMEEAGQEFSELVEIPFEFIPYEPGSMGPQS